MKISKGGERDRNWEQRLGFLLLWKKMSKTSGIYLSLRKQTRIDFFKKKKLPCLPKISMGKQQGLTINKMPSWSLE